MSAALVLYGLSLAFGGEDDSMGWALLGTLAGYACMMALTRSSVLGYPHVSYVGTPAAQHEGTSGP